MNDVVKPKKSCFVVGPIGAAGSDIRVHADWLYYEIIQRVLESFPEYDPIRADEISAPGMIDGQVVRHLIDDDLVIADLSFLNPNAFYEIGIRHAVRKPIIHMQRNEDIIPFDVNQFRSIRFAIKLPRELNEARADLRKSISAIQAADYVVDNPFVRAGAVANILEGGPPADRFLLGEVEKLRIAVSEIQKTQVFGQHTSRSGTFVPSAMTRGPVHLASLTSLPIALEISPSEGSNLAMTLRELGTALVDLTLSETGYYARFALEDDRILFGIGGVTADIARPGLEPGRRFAIGAGYQCREFIGNPS